MKMVMLLLSLTIASLSGCASSTTKPQSTDLQIVRMGVRALTEPVEVEGKIKKRRDAETGEDLWNLSGRQDDALQKSNRRALRTYQFVDEALAAIEEARQGACSRWNVLCRMKRRTSK